jgi:hypothetical protein
MEFFKNKKFTLIYKEGDVEKRRMNVVTTLATFSGLFLRMVLGALGFKKASQKLDGLCNFVENDCAEKGESAEPGYFGKALSGVGMGMLMVGMAIFGEIFYLFSKE